MRGWHPINSHRQDQNGRHRVRTLPGGVFAEACIPAPDLITGTLSLFRCASYPFQYASDVSFIWTSYGLLLVVFFVAPKDPEALLTPLYIVHNLSL